MEVVGKNLYFGNKQVIYHYTAASGARLLATTKGQGYFGYFQQEKRLLHVADGTVFLTHKQCYDNQAGKEKDRGVSKIIAVDPNLRTENVATIDNIYCNTGRYSEGLLAYDSCFIVGNTLCIMNHKNNEDWFMTYDKKNNWTPIRLNYPEQKDFKKYYNAVAPILTQSADNVLVRTEYRKGKKQKKEVMFILQPLEKGKTVTPATVVTKPPVVSQKPLKQVIADMNFAKAIRKQCPECINDANKLLAPAQNLTKLVVNEQNISDLTGLEAFSALTEFSCNDNKLTVLPKLPEGLRELACGGNQLTTLPTLPTTLIELRCGQNKLTALPKLPNSIETIVCSGNGITQLPSLPTSLQVIYLDRKISCLPNEVKGLKIIDGASGSKLNLTPCKESEVDILDKPVNGKN